MVKLIIEIKKGQVLGVSSTEELQYVIVDYDNESEICKSNGYLPEISEPFTEDFLLIDSINLNNVQEIIDLI